MASQSVVAGKFLTAVLLIVIAVLVNVIATRHIHARVDLTENKENTLSKGTLLAIERLPDRARIRAYFSQELPPEVIPYFQPAIELVNQIERVSKGKVAVDRVDPTKSNTVSEARKLGITPFEFQLNRNDTLVQSEVYLGLEIRCADRPPKVIPFLDYNNPEYEIARAFASLAGQKSVAFLTREPPGPPRFQGFDMPVPPERIFEGFRQRLKTLYKVTELVNTKYGDPIPADVDVLVLARPKDLGARERFEIDQFLMRGGRLLILLDRHEIEFGPGGPSHKAIDTGLDPLLERWGIAVPPDCLVVDKMGEMVFVPKKGPLGTTREPFQYPYFPSISKLSGGLSPNHPITKVLQGVTLFWASPLDVLEGRAPGLSVENLLQSSEVSYRTREVENTNIDSGLGRRIGEKFVSEVPGRQRLAVALVGKFPSLFEGAPIPAPAESRPSHLPKPAVADDARTVLTDGQESRVLIVGDSDLATNQFLQSSQTATVFLENAVEWLALEQDLTSIRARGQVRRIRNLEVEAMKDKAKANDTTLKASNPKELQAELVKFFEEKERITLDAREAAERIRFRVKLANVLGPGVVLGLYGLLRLVLRRRERARLAGSPKGA